MIKDVGKSKRTGVNSSSGFTLMDKTRPRSRTPSREDKNLKKALKTCPKCQQKGLNSALTFHWMGFQDGLWMCSNKECVYPLDSPSLSNYLEDGLGTELVGTKGRRFSSSNHKSKDLHSKSIDERQHTLSPLSDTQGSDVMSNQTYRTLSNVMAKDISEIAPIWSIYPLWKNEDSLCWLDVTLTLILTNFTLLSAVRKERNKTSMLWNIADLYSLLQRSFQDSKDYNDKKVQDSLKGIRKVALSFLKYKQLTDGGGFNSPIFALPLFFKDDSKLSENFCASYKVTSKCKLCERTQTSSCKRFIIPLPSCGSEFRFPVNMVFPSRCPSCCKESQVSKIEFSQKRLSPMIMLQFPNGVHRNVMSSCLPVDRRNNIGFILTQIVQYTGNHFICWSRNLRENKWLRADDLGDPVVKYDLDSPTCKPKEVFLMVWERLPVRKKATVKVEGFDCDSKTNILCSSSVTDEHTNVTLSSKQEMYKSKIQDFNNVPFKRGRYQPYMPKRGPLLRGCSVAIEDNNNSLASDESKTSSKLIFSSQTSTYSDCSSTSTCEGASSTDRNLTPASADYSEKDEVVLGTLSRNLSPISVDYPSSKSSESSFGVLSTKGVQSNFSDLQYDSAYSSPRSNFSMNNVPQDILDFLGVDDKVANAVGKVNTPSVHPLASNSNDNFFDFLGNLNIAEDKTSQDIYSEDHNIIQPLTNSSLNIDFDDL